MSAFVICSGSFDGSRCRFHPRPRTAALGLRSIRDCWGLKPCRYGLGMGLSIYRSIIEAHGCHRARRGADVRFTVPVWGSRRPKENPETAVLFVERERAPSDDSAGTTGLLVCPNFSEITPVRFSAFRLPESLEMW